MFVARFETHAFLAGNEFHRIQKYNGSFTLPETDSGTDSLIPVLYRNRE